METWYHQQPERWLKEQQSLQEAKISFQVDAAAVANGTLRLQLLITSESMVEVPEKFLPLSLTVTYPPAYPFFRPEVIAPALSLPRHQNVVAKNLCLLDRASVNWLPETMLAHFLKEQLPKVLTEGEVTDSEALKQKSDEQGEPISEYFPHLPNAPVIFDPAPFDRAISGDRPAEFLGTINIGFAKESTFPLRMMVLESFDNNETSIGKLPDTLKNIFIPHLLGAVYRLKQSPPHADSGADYQWFIGILEKQKQKLPKPKHSVKIKQGYLIENVIGLTFPEEHSPGQTSHGWLFLITLIIPVTKKIKGKNKSANERHWYYARANRINADELSFRISSLKPLADKKVSVFGLGALGGPSTLEFARNGVGQLRLIDDDIVNAGTTVRWPLGISFAGMYKTDALKRFIHENYPFTQVQNYCYSVGGSDTPDNGTLEKIIEESSLIYDATAEIGVNHFLSLQAQRKNIPYVCIYGTPGVWGGVCLRIIPGVTEGCWMCFQYSLMDGTLPVPPTDRQGDLQAPGCGDISFSGASFELDNLVSAGVRLAIGALCGPEGGYPGPSDDIGVLSLVDDHGHMKYPTWLSYRLRKHPHCPYCNQQPHEKQNLDQAIGH